MGPVRWLRTCAVVCTILVVTATSCNPEAVAQERESEIKRWIDRLDSFEPQLTIGELEGRAGTVFGRIQDALFLEPNHVVVLDAQYRDVRLFDLTGRHLLTIGGPGQGPGELTAPASLIELADGEVGVLDRRGRLNSYRVIGDSVGYTGGANLAFSPRDMCRSGSTLFIHGLDRSTDRTMHAFALDGSHSFSFAEAPNVGNWILQVQLVSGLIACSRDLQWVAAVPVVDSLISLFHQTGARRGTAVIPEFHGLQFRRLADGSITNSLPRGRVTYERVEALLPLFSAVFLVQVAALRSDSDEPVTRRTLIVDAQNNVVHSTVRVLPRILHIEASRMITARELPYPQLTVWRSRQ